MRNPIRRSLAPSLHVPVILCAVFCDPLFRFRPSRVREAYLPICTPGLVDPLYGLYAKCIIRTNSCFREVLQYHITSGPLSRSSTEYHPTFVCALPPF